MTEGWIKLHRSLLDWEWWHDINTYRVWSWCLLRANYDNQKFMGVDVPAGSFVSSWPNMAKETGLTVQNCRTAIKHLKSTDELTVKRYHDFSVFTVVKWKQYQVDQQSTNSQPTVNQQQYKKERKQEGKNVVYKPNKFNNFPQREFDYDALEEKLSGIKKG